MFCSSDWELIRDLSHTRRVTTTINHRSEKLINSHCCLDREVNGGVETTEGSQEIMKLGNGPAPQAQDIVHALHWFQYMT